MVIIGVTASKDSQSRMVIKCAKVILSFKTLLYPINSFRQIEIVYGCVVVVLKRRSSPFCAYFLSITKFVILDSTVTILNQLS